MPISFVLALTVYFVYPHSIMVGWGGLHALLCSLWDYAFYSSSYRVVRSTWYNPRWQVMAPAILQGTVTPAVNTAANLRRMYGVGAMAFVLFLSTLVGLPVLPQLSEELGAGPVVIPIVVSVAARPWSLPGIGEAGYKE